MASQHMLTEAHQEAMKETLQKLTAHHKRAKLQELCERQDKLRPHPAFLTKTRRSQSMPSLDDWEAMKSQFHDMHQETLMAQSSKQYLLRLSAVMDDGADADIETETPLPDPEGISAASRLSAERPSGSDGEQRVDDETVEEMKAEFGKYQRELLRTRFEKSFRLRADFDDEDAAREVLATSLTQRDSEEMQVTYARLSKMNLDYSTLKQLDTRVEAQIRPKHRNRFEELMKDIGIVNHSVMNRLWTNIEDTVRGEKVVTESRAPGMEEMSALRKEVGSLREQIRILKDQMKTMQNVPDSGRESQDMAAAVSRESEDEKDDDGDMLIVN